MLSNIRPVGVFAVSLAVLAALALFALVSAAGQGVATGPLPQQDLQARAIALAQGRGLQGQPTSVVSKQITMGEFNARFAPFSNDGFSSDMPVWLVLMKGKAVLPAPPTQDGAAIAEPFDNMWVLVDTNARELAWGAQAPGNEIDLNVPVVVPRAWPTPEGGEYKKCDSAGNCPLRP